MFKIDVICSTVNDVVCAMINHEESKSALLDFGKRCPWIRNYAHALSSTRRRFYGLQSFSVSRVDRVFAVLDKRDNGVPSKAKEAFPTR